MQQPYIRQSCISQDFDRSLYEEIAHDPPGVSANWNFYPPSCGKALRGKIILGIDSKDVKTCSQKKKNMFKPWKFGDIGDILIFLVWRQWIDPMKNPPHLRNFSSYEALGHQAPVWMQA